MIARVNINVLGLGLHAEDSLALFKLGESSHELSKGTWRGFSLVMHFERSFLHQAHLHVNASAASAVSSVFGLCADGGQTAGCWRDILHRGVLALTVTDV
jgi:hypothetical protein